LSRLAIRELLDNWVVWRDAGDWDRFRTVWHADGRMMATWFQGSADEFIRVTIEGWNRFYDFLDRRGGRWGLVLRQPIYEKDRIDPLPRMRRWGRMPLADMILALEEMQVLAEKLPQSSGPTRERL
jgi:hypothetical protein